MKNLLLTSLLCGLPLLLGAQQLATWLDFQSFRYTFNPAAQPFGEEGDHLAVDLAYRNQWTEFADAPRSALASLRYRNRRMNMSFGGLVANDEFGPTSYTEAQLQYAYQLQFDYTGDHFLSIGLGVAATQYRLDPTKIKTQSQADNLLASALQAEVRPNASVGLFYVNRIANSRYRTQYLFAGLSVEQAMPLDVTFAGRGDQLANLQREPHLHVTFGGRFYYGRGGDYVEPALWGRMTFYAPVNVVGGVRMTFNGQQFWGGLGLSSAWEGRFQFGVAVLENVQLGYTGSLFLANALNASAGLNHELRVSYQRWW